MSATPPRMPAVWLAMLLLLGGCATRNSELGLSEDESPGDLYVRIAAEYYRLGEMESALENAQKALDEDGDNAQAHQVLATIYQHLEQTDLAEQHFRASLALAPQDSYTRTAWGNFLCDRGPFAEAEAQYQQALANPLFNAPWIAETQAGICARKNGHYAAAEAYLRRALTASPRHVPALYEMAELEYAQRRYKSARGYLDRLFAVHGHTPKSLVLGVRVERQLGATRRARNYEKILREQFPDAPELLSL